MNGSRVGWSVLLLLLSLGLACKSSERGVETTAPLKAVGAADSKPAGPMFRDIVAGDEHTCVASAQGTVYCWGSNHNNEMALPGPGASGAAAVSDILLQPRPAAVRGLGDIVALAAASRLTCALDSQGVVSCWGYGDAAPVPVKGLAPGVKEIVMCDGPMTDYRCARHEDGTVSCWGNQYLDDTSGNVLLPSTTPVSIPEVTDAIGLACRGEIACARRQAGDAYCWGKTDLDEGPDASSAVPEPIAKPPFTAKLGTTIGPMSLGSCRNGSCWALASKSNDGFDIDAMSQVVAGPNHRCRINRGGEVACSQSPKGSDPRALEGLRAQRMAVGDSHACALARGGGIVCWGDNSKAQLGNGQWGEVVPTPTPVAGIENPRRVRGSRRASMRPWRTMAVDGEGRVMAWGDHSRPVSANAPFRAIDVAFNGIAACAISEAGRAHCAPLTADAVTGAWVALSPRGSGPSDLVSVDAGGEHFCARDTAGLAHCWGSNRKGALGVASIASAAQPARVSGLADVEQIATGDAHSCARVKSGEVYCWGKGTHQRLGVGDGQPHPSPTLVKGVSNAVDISVGKDTSCAVHADGAVTCWGRHLDSLYAGGAPPASVAFANGERATQVAVGCTHACAILSDGKLSCWGQNRFGELGKPPKKLRYGVSPARAPATVLGLDAVRRVSAGCNATCAETTDGTVRCFGVRSTVGNGSRSFDSTPRPILAPAAGW